MNMEQVIVLDVLSGAAPEVIHAKQGDASTRFVRVELTAGGVAYTPPEGATARFRCVKPDGHSCLNPAVINADGSVTVELTEQALIVPGRVLADVSLMDADGGILSSFNFEIIVEAAPVGDLSESHDQLGVYEERLEAIESRLEDVGDGTGGLLRVTAIRVTDFSRSETPSIVVATSLEDGSGTISIINLDENGYPSQIVTDGVAVPVTWEGFEDV